MIGGCRALQVQQRPEGIVDVEQLDEEGDAANHLDVDRRDQVDGLRLGDAPEAGEEAEDQREENGHDRHPEGGDEAAGYDGQNFKVRLRRQDGQDDDGDDGAEEGDVPGREDGSIPGAGDQGAIGDVDVESG